LIQWNSPLCNRLSKSWYTAKRVKHFNTAPLQVYLYKYDESSSHTFFVKRITFCITSFCFEPFPFCIAIWQETFFFTRFIALVRCPPNCCTLPLTATRHKVLDQPSPLTVTRLLPLGNSTSRLWQTLWFSSYQHRKSVTREHSLSCKRWSPKRTKSEACNVEVLRIWGTHVKSN